MTEKSNLNLKWLITIFAAGMAWGVTTLQLHNIQSEVTSMSSRLSHVEQYMVKESKGAFIPGDPQ